MLPIDKFTITKKKQKDGCLLIHGGLRHDFTTLLTPIDQAARGVKEHVEDNLREKIWRSTYGDLREPLDELMYLAWRAVASNPCAYPEAARIEELIKELNELLDWRKQLAAKQEKEKK